MSRGVFSYSRITGGLSLAGLLLVNAAQAGEKIHFSDSPEKVDVPKPTTRDEQISSRFGAPKTQGPDSGPSVSSEPAAIRPAGNPLLNQKLEEYLDKKRNWMFIDPKEKDKDQFGSDRALQSKEISFESDKKKTVQEQFYEHPSDKTDARKKNGTDEERDGNDKTRDSDRDDKPDLESNRLTPELSLGSLLRQADQTDAGMRTLKDMSRAGSLGSFTPDPSEAARKVERERDLKQHDADFARIIAPRSGGATFSASGDPVNTQNDMTRQEVNPFAPRTGFGSYSTGPSADAAPSIVPGSNLPRQGGADSFASQLPSAPTFSSLSTFSATPAPSFQSEHQPIFFRPPQRKF